MAMSDYVRRLRGIVGNELLLVPAVAVGLFDADGRLLLARRSDAERWTLIGGAIDPGETPSQAAVREAREEASVEVVLTALRGAFGGPDFRATYDNGDRIEATVILYEGEISGGAMRPDEEELCELRFVAHADLGALPMSAGSTALARAAFEARASGAKSRG